MANNENSHVVAGKQEIVILVVVGLQSRGDRPHAVAAFTLVTQFKAKRAQSAGIKTAF